MDATRPPDIPDECTIKLTPTKSTPNFWCAVRRFLKDAGRRHQLHVELANPKPTKDQ